MLGAPNANAAREFPVVLMPCGKMLWKGVWNQAARVVCNKIRCPYSQLLSGLSAFVLLGRITLAAGPTKDKGQKS
jgi:hypothetical protein